jgi:hypothetical protein
LPVSFTVNQHGVYIPTILAIATNTSALCDRRADCTEPEGKAGEANTEFGIALSFTPTQTGVRSLNTRLGNHTNTPRPCRQDRIRDLGVPPGCSSRTSERSSTPSFFNKSEVTRPTATEGSVVQPIIGSFRGGTMVIALTHVVFK